MSRPRKLPEGSSYIAVKLSPATLRRLDRRKLDTFARSRAEVARDLIESGLHSAKRGAK